MELNAKSTFGAAVLLLFLAVSSTWLHAQYRLRRRGLKPLPGPISIPLLGCVTLPRTYTWRTLAAWSKHYGPIYRVVSGRDTYVVLGTAVAITDLLQHRASIWASRPLFDLASDTGATDVSVLFTPYGPLFHTHRAAEQPVLSKARVARLQQGADQEIRVLLRDLAQDPLGFRAHIDRYHASSLLQIVYGSDFGASSDVQTLVQISEHLSAAMKQPGRSFFGAFATPEKLRRWSMRASKTSDAWLLEALGACKRMLSEVREAEANGKALECFALDIVRSQTESESLTDDEAAFLAGSSFSIGSSSLSAVLASAIMAFVLYPEAADRARHEIDCLVPSDRLPTYDDLQRLPYTACFIKELLRWRPVAPGGVPHRLLRDDTYMGYHLPRGAIVLGNTESSHNDEAVFDAPHAFKPERWLHRGTPEAILDLEHSNDKLVIHAFGFDMVLAIRSLGTSVPALLWGFEFAHALDEQGNRIPIDPLKFSDSLFSAPLPFKAAITPRSEERKRVMLTAEETDFAA